MRARWVGRASGAPIVDLGVLVPVSMTEKRQVTSAPEVPGPSTPDYYYYHHHHHHYYYY